MFTEAQLKCLQALVNCIIPADDFPNGWDAGVGDYLLRQLEGDLKDKVGLYQTGLSLLDAETQAVYYPSFATIAMVMLLW